MSNNQGYVLVYKPAHPKAYCHGSVKRSILVMEQVLGRFLLPSEHIHHINGIRSDDRPENLMVVTNSEHACLHMKKQSNLDNYNQIHHARPFHGNQYVSI